MRSRKKVILVVLTTVLCILIGLLYDNTEKKEKKERIIKAEEKLKTLDTAKNSYSDYVNLLDGTYLYKKTDNLYEVDSVVHGKIEVTLDPNYKITNEYLKLKDIELYVNYKNIEKIEKLTELKNEYKYYKNYIPWNINITLTYGANLYIDNDNYYEVNGGKYNVIIKEEDKYGIEYHNRLVYVKKEDVESIEEKENTEEEANSIAVLNYHYTVSSKNEFGELRECQQIICITDTAFDSQIKYLKESNFYGASLRDLELFIEDKIRLPKKTVVVTIDDGWYVTRSIEVLNKYEFLGTLFLIGSLASPDNYNSPYLEIHSHTWNMHKIGDCPTGNYGGGILCLNEETILEDLKKSRESLNNTTYFCYPFYDYNQRAIELLKKAGFTMAFAGGETKVKKGQNKFIVPRYVINNGISINNFKTIVN